MDDPAPPAPEVLEPGKPKPLSKLEKQLYAAFAVVGVLLIALTFYMMDSNLPVFVIGCMAGGGGAMLAVSIMKLFHRPDR